MIKISASMLAADYTRFGQEALRMEQAGIDYLHMDVMDGQFVPNISFGAGVIEAIHKQCAATLDVHLMVNDPMRYVDDFVHAGASILTIHAECTPHLHRALALIRQKGMLAGVALNPATPLDALRYVLDEVDLVLIMTVNPGFGGQKLISAMLDKTREAARMIAGRNILLEVDGGVAVDTASILRNAGANVLVAGSALFGAPDIAKMLRTLREE